MTQSPSGRGCRSSSEDYPRASSYLPTQHLARHLRPSRVARRTSTAHLRWTGQAGSCDARRKVCMTLREPRSCFTGCASVRRASHGGMCIMRAPNRLLSAPRPGLGSHFWGAHCSMSREDAQSGEGHCLLSTALQHPMRPPAGRRTGRRTKRVRTNTVQPSQND